MIGIFDSGLGGLTVARHIISAYPQEDIYYLADTLEAPYGEKTSDRVAEISVHNADFLLSQGASIVVIACNTATASGISFVRAKFPEIPIIGVIEPTAQVALAATHNNRIGVLATSLTVKTQAYIRCLEQYSREKLQLTQVAAPLFVPLIDKGITRGKRLYSLAQQYCAGLIAAQVDTVILGCTHYPLVSAILQDILGDEVQLINGSMATARALQNIYPLPAQSERPLREAAKYYFSSNSNMPDFEIMCRRFLAKYAREWPGKMIFPQYSNRI